MMALEQIRFIRDCEKECLEKKKAALSNARQIVLSANKEAANIIEESRKTVMQKSNELLLKAKEEGQKEFDLLVAQATEQSRLISQGARKNMDAAIDIIIKRVVSSYGNR